MGTRADFYIGRGKGAKWLGSIAWDGYPAGLDDVLSGVKSEDGFRAAMVVLAERDDWTSPDQGWPWPWTDSQTSDFAYAWDGSLFCACFGKGWISFSDATDSEDPFEELEKQEFPDMSERKNVTMGGRSGVMVVTAVCSDHD